MLMMIDVTPTGLLFIAFDEDSTSGVLTTGGQDVGMIVYTNDDADDIIVTIDETGSNTGVFESQSDDNSEISVNSEAPSGDTFTIGYADDDQQIIVNDFSSTLELIADGTWDSGEPLTIRLSSENLDLNTLDDEDMTIGSPDLAVLMVGDPITLGNVERMAHRSICQIRRGHGIVNDDTHVLTANDNAGSTTLTIKLTDSQLETAQRIPISSHYVHYSTASLLLPLMPQIEAFLRDADYRFRSHPRNRMASTQSS